MRLPQRQLSRKFFQRWKRFWERLSWKTSEKRRQFPTKPRSLQVPLLRGSTTPELTKVMQASKPNCPVGGRLHFFKSEWYKITSDPNILDMVSGMHIDLKSLPSQHSYPQPLRLSPEEVHPTDD